MSRKLNDNSNTASFKPIRPKNLNKPIDPVDLSEFDDDQPYYQEDDYYDGAYEDYDPYDDNNGYYQDDHNEPYDNYGNYYNDTSGKEFDNFAKGGIIAIVIIMLTMIVAIAMLFAHATRGIKDKPAEQQPRPVFPTTALVTEAVTSPAIETETETETEAETEATEETTSTTSETETATTTETTTEEPAAEAATTTETPVTEPTTTQVETEPTEAPTETEQATSFVENETIPEEAIDLDPEIPGIQAP